jgi:hypothetical protein
VFRPMPADRYTRRLKSPIGLQRQAVLPFDNGTEEFMRHLADTLSGQQHRVSL